MNSQSINQVEKEIDTNVKMQFIMESINKMQSITEILEGINAPKLDWNDLNICVNAIRKIEALMVEAEKKVSGI